MFRRIGQILCWLSLLLSIAFALLWWRSYSYCDTWTTPRIAQGFGVSSGSGAFVVNVRWTNPMNIRTQWGVSTTSPWHSPYFVAGPYNPLLKWDWGDWPEVTNSFSWRTATDDASSAPSALSGPRPVEGGRVLCIAFPHWSAVAFFGLFPAIYLPILVRRWIIRRRLARLGLCRRCGYDLRASADRCPECGQAFTRPMESTEPILPRA